MRPFALVLAAAVLVATAVDGSAHRSKGEGPTAIAFAYGSIWVGMGNGDVIRIDARSGRETARIKGGPTEFVHGIVAAYGAVWALRGRLVRIDGHTNRMREVRGLGNATAHTIRAGRDALWIADDGSNSIARIDPKRAAVTASIKIPGRAWGVAAGERDVLAVSIPTRGPVIGPSGPHLLHRIDPRTNRLSRALLRLDCDPAIAVGPEVVWLTDPCAGLLLRLDRETLQPLAKLSVPCWHMWCVPVVAFGSVWLIGGERVVRVNPETLHVVASIRARGMTAVAGSRRIWLLDIGNGMHGFVRKIDPNTNRIVGSPIPIATS